MSDTRPQKSAYSWKNKNCDVEDEARVHEYEPVSVENKHIVTETRLCQVCIIYTVYIYIYASLTFNFINTSIKYILSYTAPLRFKL